MYRSIRHSLIALVVITEVLSIQEKEIKLGISSSCNHEVFYPDDENSFILQWRGEDPGGSGCKVRFQGNSDTYETCVEVIDFCIQNHGIFVKYYTGEDADKLEKTFQKYDYSPETFCKTDEAVAVEVITERIYSWKKVNTSGSYFTLNITSTSTATVEDATFTEYMTPLIIAVALGLCSVCSYICRALYSGRSVRRGRQRSQGEGNASLQLVSLNAQAPREQENTQTLHTDLRLSLLETSTTHAQSEEDDSYQSVETPANFNFPIHVNGSSSISLDHNRHNNLGADGTAYQLGPMPSAPPPPPPNMSAGAQAPDMAPPSYSEVMNIK